VRGFFASGVVLAPRQPGTRITEPRNRLDQLIERSAVNWHQGDLASKQNDAHAQHGRQGWGFAGSLWRGTV